MQTDAGVRSGSNAGAFRQQSEPCKYLLKDGIYHGTKIGYERSKQQ